MEKAKIVEAVKALKAVVFKNEKDEEVPLCAAAAKIKVVAVKEEDLRKAFIAACNTIPGELEQYLPDAIAAVYNTLGEEAKAAGKTAPAGTEAPPKEDQKTAPAKKAAETDKPPKAPGTTKKTGETLAFMSDLVKTGQHTAKEIVKKTVEALSVKESSAATLLSDGKNPKYNKFAALIVAGEGGKLSFKK
jgi:hypothetical protein